MHVRVAGELSGEALGVVALLQVVQFLTDGVGELCGETDDVVVDGRRPPARGADGEVVQDLQIDVHLLHDAGPAHLDHDVRTVCEHRQVRLPDRGAGERLGVEPGERFSGGAAELLGDRRLDRVGRYRRGAVLELGQLFLEVAGKQVGTRGQDLPQLDERRAELLQRQSEVFGLRVGLGTALVAEQPVLQGQPAVQAGDRDEVPHAVPGQDQRDLPVPRVLTGHDILASAGRSSAGARPSGWRLAATPGWSLAGRHVSATSTAAGLCCVDAVTSTMDAVTM